MKKFYYSLFTAASMMLAVTSCSQEEDIVQSSNQMATFHVSLEGASQSRAAGDGKTAKKLYYEVYQGQGTDRKKVWDNYGVGKTTTGEVETIGEGLKTEVKIPLLIGEKYDIMFWAQAESGSIYTPDDLQNITVNYTNAKANNEANDAFFYGETDYEALSNVKEIKLKRPFAQLNVGTTTEDWNRAYNMTDKTILPVTKSMVTVTGLADKFNVLTGAAEGAVDVTFGEFENSVLVDNNLLGTKDPSGKLTDGEKFSAKGGQNNYYYLAMNYLLVPGEASSTSGLEVKGTTNVTATFYRGEQKLFDITNLSNLSIQRNWRTNILGDLLADDKTFTIEILPGFNNEDHDIDYSSVDNDVDLNTALKNTTDDDIVINLASSSRSGKIYTINVGADDSKYYFGGAKTKTITINANDNTICFNHENTDWNYIRCVNDDTKWIINDAHLTNSGANNGPWNRHNIRFYNAVELNKVTSDKAIALLNDGKLKDVTISDVHPDNSEAYGLWITAQGQTVDIDSLKIIAHDSKTTDRGIKIEEQYVESPELVTLNVKNAKFVTQKKAAILVKSVAGAKITLENLDLTGVKADQFNAVWVDDASKDYADKVTVEGGFVVVEDATSTPENNPFLVPGATVNVAKGVYGALPTMANGVTIEAEVGTVFTGTSSVAGENVTIKNITFKGTDKALTNGLKNVTFENCQFDATYGAQWCYAYGDVKFKNCVFGTETSKRGIHFDGGDGTVSFEACTFYAFNALGQANKKYTFNNCDIKVSSNALNGFNGVNMYGTTYEYTDCRFAPGTFTDCASNNVKASYTNCEYTDDKSIYSLVRFDKDPTTCTITFDGNYFVNNVACLNKALDDDQISKIILGNSEFGTIVAKSEKTIIGQPGAKVNCVNLNGAANLTLKNIKFDAAKAVQGYNGKGNATQYANIISGDSQKQGKGAKNLVIEGCTFEGKFANGGVAIAFTDQGRGSGQSGNITIKNCTFNTQGGYVDIYTYYSGDGYLKIEGNTFNSTVIDKPIYLCRYQSSTPVVVKGNAFNTKASFADATYIQAHSTAYTVSFADENNSFATANE